jgi:translocation and assembly module TamB
MRHVKTRMSRRHKWLVIVLTPCLVLAGGATWLVASSPGLRWLTGVVEHQSGGKLSAHGVNGSLFATFGMQQLVLHGDGWRITMHDAQIQWQPAALLRGELKVLRLDARQVEVLSLPSAQPPVLPDSLGLPLTLNVSQMKLDTLSIISKVGAAPDFVASKVEARFLGDANHLQLQMLKAHLSAGEFAGSAEIASTKPYVLKAQASLDTAMQLSGRLQKIHFTAESSGDLQHIIVKLDGNGAGVSINGTARLAPFSAVPVSHLKFVFSGLDAGRLFDGVPPALVSGSADLNGTPGGELEGSLSVRNAHAAALDRNGLPVRGVTARVRLSSSLWQLEQLDVQLLNGSHITGTASWAQPRGKLAAQLRVHDFDPSALDTRLPSTKLQGDITLNGIGADQHAVVTLSDGKLDLHGELDRHSNRIYMSGLRMTRGSIVLNGHGQLALDRRRTFSFSSRLSKLNLSEFATTPPTDLNIGLEISGTLLPQVQGTLQLDMSHSRFAQHDISGNGHVEFSGTRRATGALTLRMGENHLNLEVTHGIQADRAQLIVDAPRLDQFGNGMGGQLAARGVLSGSITQHRLQFSAQGSNLVLPGGQRIAGFNGSGDLSSANMQMNLGMTEYQGSGAMNIPEASIELNGSRAHHTLLASARIDQDQEASGEVKLKMDGGLSDPAQGWKNMQWRGEVDELSAQGILPFRLLQAAPLTLAMNSVELGTANVAIAGGQIQFSGMQWILQRWHSAGHFTGLNVRAVNMPQNQPRQCQPVPAESGYMHELDTMRVGGAWDVAADEHLHGQFQVHRESGDWIVHGNTDQPLGLSNMQLSVRAEQDQLHAKLEASGEHLGEIKAQASMPLTRTETGWTFLSEAPLAGHLHLHSDDLSWLGPILDSNLQSGGRLNLDADLTGTLAYPRLQGDAQGDALSLAFLNQGIRLEQGELKARFDPDAVHIDRLVFSAPYLASPSDSLLADYRLPAGSGTLSASGQIDLKGDTSDLKITAEHLPLAQRADRWIIASGTGHARYAAKILMLDGNIQADAGLINQPVTDRPSLSADVHIVGQEPGSRAGPPTRVNATLDLGDHFYIRASGFEGRLAGQLNMHGEPGELMHVTGSIAAQNAVFNAYGQSLTVERGIVNFQGPLDDPGLNILAVRKGLDVEAGVEVTGTVRHPIVRLVSTPNVPDAEKLSWIVLGRVPDTSGVDSALLLAAAGSILGGQSSGQLGKSLGVDEISLSQQTGVDSQPIQKLTVGKQLSSRARISYEQSLNQVGSSTIFTYTLTPRINIVTRTGTEDAVDIFYTFRFY